MIKWIQRIFFKNKADNLSLKDAIESHKVRNLNKEIKELDRLLDRKDARILTMEDELLHYQEIKQQDKWISIAGKVLGIDMPTEKPLIITPNKTTVTEEDIKNYITKIPEKELTNIKSAPDNLILDFVNKNLGWDKETGLKAIKLIKNM